MRVMENLAPAGNFAALERACAGGAGAVYLGFSAFSARAGAGNFNREELREAVHFAHLHHMRVHVTVNILIKDEEMPQVVEVLRYLNELGVDAVLVQDLGVLSVLRSCFPSLPVHASTQMALHNRTGAAWCRDMGMQRVVLARECSLAEIEKCALPGDIEIEVFGHGAQCVSVSGQCLFSSCIGGRSGNRGRCAQPCRLMYRYRGKTGAWLSPRDVCTRDYLDAFEKAGVASLKTEGRLKRPEYVAVVAESYSRGRDSAASGHFRAASREEKQGLMQIFQRGGFMDGYAFGSEDAAVIDPVHVSHTGIRLGTVTRADSRFATVLLEHDLHDGDQLAFGETREGEMIYSGRPCAEGEQAEIRLRPGMQVRKGDRVRRLVDAQQLARAQALPIPKIPLTGTLRAIPGEVLSLRLTDGISQVSVEAGIVQTAQKKELTEEDAVRSIGKMGDTPFVLEALDVETAHAFVPASELNSIRRTCLEQMEHARAAAFGRPKGEEYPPEAVTLPTGEEPSLLIVRSASQLRAVPKGVRLAWHPEDYREEALEKGLCGMPEGIWLQLPEVCEEDTLQMLRAFAHRHADRLGGVILGSVGQLGAAWELPFGAGTGVPVMNRRAAALLFGAGCRFVTASLELTGEEMKRLAEGCGKILLPAYGRTQLMLLHHCPARVLLGLREGHADCRMCDLHSPDALEGTELVDMHGAAYPLLRERLREGCLIRLMESSPVNNVLKAKAFGCPVLMELTDETDASSVSVPGRNSGHWNKPVE